MTYSFTKAMTTLLLREKCRDDELGVAVAVKAPQELERQRLRQKRDAPGGRVQVATGGRVYRNPTWWAAHWAWLRARRAARRVRAEATAAPAGAALLRRLDI